MSEKQKAIEKAMKEKKEVESKLKEYEKTESTSKFDMKLTEQGELTIQKTKQRINLLVFGRGGESSLYVEYFNWQGRKIKTNPRAKRLYGIGTCSFTAMVPLDRLYNDKRPILTKVPYKQRNRLTGKFETKYRYERSGSFIYGWRAVAQHLSKFMAITTEELKELVAPYKDAPRIYIYSAYEEKGVSLHGQPKTVENFMGFKNYWKCSSGKPIACNPSHSEQRFLWLNERIKQLAKQQGLKGFWQTRVVASEIETI